jgi:hypothetical protein
MWVDANRVVLEATFDFQPNGPTPQRSRVTAIVGGGRNRHDVAID